MRKTYSLFIALTSIYILSIPNFLSGDDWFHLRITQIHSISEFLNFFSFIPNAQSAALYRPLPTQVFFFIFQKIFGLTVWSYHLFVLLCFSYSLYLLYLFAKKQFNDKTKALLTVSIYGLSVSNFTRLYFLSSFQEISLVIFSLLCLLSFPKSKIKALLFFILALLSKETAVVLPVLLVLFNFTFVRKNFKQFLPISVVLAIYLYLRFKFFGNAVGDSYLWNFSPIKAANTLMWYALWCLGAPELLVDYVGSGLRLVPKFFTDYAFWWKIILPLLLGTITTISILFVQRIKKVDLSFLRYLLFFLVSLTPVLFLPAHKFALELGLPLVGFSLVIVWLLPKRMGLVSYLFVCLYALLNLSMNYLTYTRHYSVSRAEISQRIYLYLSKNYPKYPTGSYFEFINDTEDNGKQWGQSKQISQAISGSDMFQVFYRDPSIKIFYQDIPEARSLDQKPILLSTKQFIQP